MKLQSSLTLFSKAAQEESLFRAALLRWFRGTEDRQTLAVLKMACLCLSPWIPPGGRGEFERHGLDLVAPNEGREPVGGNAFPTVERPRKLAGDCGNGVAVLAEVGSEQHGFGEARGPRGAPRRRLEAVDDIARAADRPAGVGAPRPAGHLGDAARVGALAQAHLRSLTHQPA